MKICGLQKTTLLDYPGKVACTVFIGWCNFDCPYCHNRELIRVDTRPTMSEKEFFDWLETRVGTLEGVVISGGEPTLNADLPEFMRKIKDLGFSVKLDTNGSGPEMLEKVIFQGLVDYIAMDIKGKTWHYYHFSRCKADDLIELMAKIRKSIDLIMSNLRDYEFRTTVVREFHNITDLYFIAKSVIPGAKLYALQKYEPRDGIPYDLHPVSDKTMYEYKELAETYVKKCVLRGVE